MSLFSSADHSTGNCEWAAEIRYNGKREAIGYFGSEVGAAEGWAVSVSGGGGVKKCHKEAVVLNFPD
jgi:hypothetical protein